MQIHVSIAMDHYIGDMKLTELKKINLKYGLDGSNSAIELQLNDDAVKISIFVHDPYDFANVDFLSFLHKHFNSYLKLVGIAGMS